MPSLPTKPVPNNLQYPPPIQYPTTAFAEDGAITLLGGGYGFLTKASAGAYTLALPTVDGARLVLISTTAYQHVVTTPANGVNGDNTTLTWGAAADNMVELISYNGSWYVAAVVNVVAS